MYTPIATKKKEIKMYNDTIRIRIQETWEKLQFCENENYSCKLKCSINIAKWKIYGGKIGQPCSCFVCVFVVHHSNLFSLLLFFFKSIRTEPISKKKRKEKKRGALWTAYQQIVSHIHINRAQKSIREYQ